MTWDEAKISVSTALTCLPDTPLPEHDAKSQQRKDPEPAPESASPVSGNSPPGSDAQSVAAHVPTHHRFASQGLLALPALPNATKHRSSAPLLPCYGPPSTESRSHVASASPTSSPLRSRTHRCIEGFYRLKESLGVPEFTEERGSEFTEPTRSNSAYQVADRIWL